MHVSEIRPGLWRWTAAHPEWEPGVHWPQQVSSVYAELPDAAVVVDPLVPDDEPDRFWDALDRDVAQLGRAVHVLLTVHWHERSAEAVIERYHATLWRPEESSALPRGVRAELVRGVDWVEALFFLEPSSALVVGDLLIGDDAGGLRVPTSWFPKEEQDWVRTGLKERLRAALGDLQIELVLVSHGEPVLENARAALQTALES